MSFTIKL